MDGLMLPSDENDRKKVFNFNINGKLQMEMNDIEMENWTAMECWTDVIGGTKYGIVLTDFHSPRTLSHI